ncbi:CHASE2 domain-containing protein [Myxacorys almedinensis]|uniref:CHASE2 domain-containing protein n=1 Tax=Myxacorys almedinensis A TaxID=2690445 RepID=A0A8J7Z3B9_9CYAN|nr:adenylate/guanylate cyclase domain-containing protein [Myxacorys almedinensis]NDJ15748.1 CHASE2 domain-containing protein [Myxacorys almedinensis A]
MLKNVKRIVWQWRGVLIAAPSVAGLVVLVRLTGMLQPLEWTSLDQYFRLRPEEPKDPRITIVGVTEADIQTYGFPLPDQTLATVLKKIKQQQPRAIGLDLYRDLPVGTGYADLTSLFKSTPNLVGIQKVVGRNGIGTVAPPPVLKKLGQVAANDLVLDGDGKLRRGLLSISDACKLPCGNAAEPDAARHEPQEHLSLAFALSLLYLQKEGIEPEATESGRIKLGQTELVPFEADDGGYVRAEAAGYQILLNYQGSDRFDVIPISQVLQDTVAPEKFRDRVVLIGSTAESLNDFFETPYSVRWQQLRHPTPGVELHGELVSQVLRSVLNQRPFLRTWSEGQEGMWIIGWAFVGALLVWQQRFALHCAAEKGTETMRDRLLTPHFQSLKILLSLLVASVGLFGLTYLAFLQSVWVPVVPPFLALTGSAIAVTAYLAQSAAELRKTLGRYLTNEVVSNLLETPEGLKLIGEKRKITILMCDIRGFTSISEQLPPEQVVLLLNMYLDIITKVIQQYNGTINDITGDGIVVFFGAPLQQDNDSHRAVACAIAMQLAMETVNQRSQALSLPTLEIGIGINTGEAVIGNIGSEELAKYTAIGSHVNLAARIESFTVGGQLLISQTTYDEVQSVVQLSGQTQAFLKGVSQAVPLYDVSGIGEPYSVFLPEERDVVVVLKDAIALEYEILEGKHLAGERISGMLTKLSSKGAEIDGMKSPPPLSNLKLRVFFGSEVMDDIYAKAITKDAESETSFQIRFTTLPKKVEEAFQTLRGDRRARK